MSTADVSICANCGKEGANNVCNKCKQVKYCNAVCKKVHKKKHKKDCEEHVRLATEKHKEELRIAVELHEEKLFEEPPPEEEDCPICFQRMPVLKTGYRYYSCCGKIICSGCTHAPLYDNQGNKVAKTTCPFCRTTGPTSDEVGNERERKRMEVNDPNAIFNIGCYHRDGTNGFPQDYTKALELWHRAGKLGHAGAYCRIGYAYNNGEGVDVDKKEARHYNELAAMRGDEVARNNIGTMEKEAGNKERAVRHYMLAVRGGEARSLDTVKDMYLKGQATKNDYTTALQAYQTYLDEIKSKQRDEAAAFDERYRYY